MATSITFPIVCHTEEDINVLIPIITKWYINKTRLHFNALSHLSAECDMQKQKVNNGQHPCIKIIYIAKHLEKNMQIIINQLINHFPESSDEDDSEGEQLEKEARNDINMLMLCPICGLNFGDQ